MFLFYTQLQKRDVIDRHGRWIGWPHDFLINFDGTYPPVTGLIIRTGRLRRQYVVVPWSQIHMTTVHRQEAFQVRLPLESLVFTRHPPIPAEPTLRRNILDQQVVDTYNRKVVRVNDVHLLRVNSSFRIAHVDVGLRGMIRRLGWEKPVDWALHLVHPHARYLTRDGFIAWKYVQPLTINPVVGTIPLAVSQAELDKIPPADLSDILVELDPYQRVALFKSLDSEMQGEILGELEQRFQRELISELDIKTAVDVLERMPADEATDILQEVPRRDRERILGAMSVRKANKLSELLVHEEDSAGGLMTTELIRLQVTCTVGEAIERIKAMHGIAETLYYTYVVDDQQHLEGVASFRTLLVEPLDRPITEIMGERPIAVRVNDSAKAVAFILDKYNLFAVPVIDDQGILQGIVTVDDILSIAIDAAWGEKSGLM
ncbi:MAG: magnesium transporter [Deltaproteobacteria bacterium]|nr:magnesium transporter [Deltaproteobacteria bacterium]